MARGGPPVATMHGPGGPSVAAVHGPGGQVTARTTYGVIGILPQVFVKWYTYLLYIHIATISVSTHLK